MSWNNVIPSWLIAADSVLNQYQEGRIDYDRVLKKLRDLEVPETMITRLYQAKAFKSQATTTTEKE